MITIYVAIVISRWSENRMVLQSYEHIYNKKLRYKHHKIGTDKMKLEKDNRRNVSRILN